MRVNIKQLKKWIAALDSGKYKQGAGTLQNSTGHCCLGVACRVLIKDNLLQKDTLGIISGGYPGDQKNAPKWLTKINMDVYCKTGTQLSTLNDVNMLSFPEIATVLELIYIHKILD